MAVKMNCWTRRQFMKLSTAAALQMMLNSSFSFASSSTKRHAQMERQKRIQNSPQYTDGEFVNPIEVHMLPEEAVQQHQDLRGGLLVPLHWATFDLGLHPWYEPIERTLTAARETDIRTITPIIGEQININRLPEENPWWRSVDKRQEQTGSG